MQDIPTKQLMTSGNTATQIVPLTELVQYSDLNEKQITRS